MTQRTSLCRTVSRRSLKQDKDAIVLFSIKVNHSYRIGLLYRRKEQRLYDRMLLQDINDIQYNKIISLFSATDSLSVPVRILCDYSTCFSQGWTSSHLLIISSREHPSVTQQHTMFWLEMDRLSAWVRDIERGWARRSFQTVSSSIKTSGCLWCVCWAAPSTFPAGWRR